MEPTATQLIGLLPPYRDEWVMTHPNQGVGDIIHDVLQAHREFSQYYDRIEQLFEYSDIKDTCDALYRFCKKYLKYEEESEETQTTALPTGLLIRGHCDCKGYAGFCGGILDAIRRQTGDDIDWYYRFTSYRIFDPLPHHVFVVCKDKNGEEIWIDPTPDAEKMSPVWQVDKKEKSMPLYRNIAGVKIGDTYPAPVGPSAPSPTQATGTSTQSGGGLLSILSNLFGGGSGGSADLTSIFGAVAAGGNPYTAVASIASSPQVGQMITGITNNIKALVEGIESIFHHSGDDPLVKVYQMFPINTAGGLPSYVQIDAQINAANAYFSPQNLYQKGLTDRKTMAWFSAWQALVANYGTLSTWLKIQEALQQSASQQILPGISTNTLLAAGGAYLLLTGKKKKQVTGATKPERNALLLLGLIPVLFVLAKPKPIEIIAPDEVTDIKDLPTVEQITAAQSAPVAVETANVLNITDTVKSGAVVQQPTKVPISEMQRI